jgi:very-short-patch-repair endonuclease
MRGLRLHETRRARGLRHGQTEGERQLWRRLRNRTLGGFKFVRQEPIGPYFGDFVCREEKLVIEVDGATHSTEDERHRDGAREQFLQDRGYRVARFGNDEIYRNIEGVLDTILATLERRGTQVRFAANLPRPSPQPSPRQDGERENLGLLKQRRFVPLPSANCGHVAGRESADQE